MPLRELPLRLSYRTGRNDMVGEFFVPCLEQSSLYRRSAGYFTSHGLALAARGVASLVARNGEMRLVVSPQLEPEDVEALQNAIDQPMSLLESIAAKSMVDVQDALVRDRLNALAWLAAAGFLKVKLALRVDDAGEVARGIYHEKIGIFTDAEGDHVAFNGSANETAGGFMENFESFDVFRSWNDADGRVAEKIANFEDLWDDHTPGLRTFDFSKVGRELLEAFRDPDRPPPGFPQHLLHETGERSFRAPRGFDLRDYQAEASREWSRKGGKGILAMATGAGKTLTALYLASKVAEKNSPMVLIVVCPFINLCKQWLREMAGFGLNPVPCYEGRQRWESLMEEGYQRISAGLSNVHSIVHDFILQPLKLGCKPVSDLSIVA